MPAFGADGEAASEAVGCVAGDAGVIVRRAGDQTSDCRPTNSGTEAAGIGRATR